ncbi:MAG: hypothetical protein AWU57_301 [Marinobacter sp. T13-3]|nr:MAG: hypothetical protein AWU57_301 [Marinobacter sp. T13-3]
MTTLQKMAERPFFTIANAEGQPEQIFSSHQNAYVEFERRLDAGATHLDLQDFMTAPQIMGMIEFSELPNMITYAEWPEFAESVRAGYEDALVKGNMPPVEVHFLRDGVQPDLPAELARRMLATLDYYTAPRYPEFQYACELTEIILAEKAGEPVNHGRFSQASLMAQEPYSMLYLSLTSDALEEHLKAERKVRVEAETKLEPHESPAAMCNADIKCQKLEYALQDLRPDQRIKEDIADHQATVEEQRQGEAKRIIDTLASDFPVEDDSPDATDAYDDDLDDLDDLDDQDLPAPG